MEDLPRFEHDFLLQSQQCTREPFPQPPFPSNRKQNVHRALFIH